MQIKSGNLSFLIQSYDPNYYMNLKWFISLFPYMRPPTAEVVAVVMAEYLQRIWMIYYIFISDLKKK